MGWMGIYFEIAVLGKAFFEILAKTLSALDF